MSYSSGKRLLRTVGRRPFVAAIVAACSLAGLNDMDAQDPSLVGGSYTNDFEAVAEGKLPEDVAAISGIVTVKVDQKNHFLEFPGEPLDTCGVLIGPAGVEGQGGISARIFATATGRRFPAFAVGLLGVGGYRLQVTAAKTALEIQRAGVVNATVPFKWVPGTWTLLRLQIRRGNDGQSIVEGKAWAENQPEPSAWLVSFVETGKLPTGRASLWGTPYSGTPIRFDDVKIEPKPET